MGHLRLKASAFFPPIAFRRGSEKSCLECIAIFAADSRSNRKSDGTPIFQRRRRWRRVAHLRHDAQNLSHDFPNIFLFALRFPKGIFQTQIVHQDDAVFEHR
ncbi:MAG: hypothetical protein REDVDVYQ_001170 [Candidatus Fervidibacter sp.]